MNLQYKGIQVFYQDKGSGDCLVLLHGFLENHSMWDDLIAKLALSHRVIAVDLLGHGKTDSIGYIHTMEAMADCVLYVLDHLKVQRYTLIGHSMGGYVALAMAFNNKEAISGLCLLNSTYRADDLERIKLRKRANGMAKKNLEALIRMSFINLFSEESRSLKKQEVEKAMQEALKTSLQAYLAAQEGMMKRVDRLDFFKALEVKRLIILGAEDGLIDVDTIRDDIKNSKVELRVLPGGHMTHIENKKEFTYNILQFIEK